MSSDRPRLLCLVEIPKGSRNKYEWDEELQAITLDRFLFSSVVYPTDYGFVPQTLAEDGDPLDAMVLVTEPTFPGCVIPVKPIALFKMRDDKGVDDKVLCVPLRDPNWNTLETLEDLPISLRDEISHFFSIYKQPEGKVVKVDGWHDLETALQTIDEARERWHRMEGLMDAVRTPDELLAELPAFPWASQHRTVEDGLRMAHLDEGEGAPVVFFHGEPTWSFLWRKVIPPVRDAGFRCIAPDLLGFGRSDKPMDIDWYSYDRHTASIAALLEDLDLRDATIVVHDWGGPIGLRARGRARPSGSARLVILDTGLFTGRQR